QDSITALKANLVTATDATALQSGSQDSYQRFVTQLAGQLPTQIQCVELSDIKTQQAIARTCNEPLLPQATTKLWPGQQRSPSQVIPKRDQVYVATLLPGNSSVPITKKGNSSHSMSQLKLLLSAPVYDAAGQLRYALSIQSALLPPERAKPGLLSGNPVVINEAGTILTHPYLERIGNNISQEADAKRLKAVVSNAIAGRQDFQHLVSFEKNGVEVLAGYTSIPSPIPSEQNQKWVILAVTRLDSALYGLKDIQQALIIMTCGLIAASLLAMIYLARDLARPLEKLRDYALNESELHSTERMPHNFNIREFNQLSEALDGMVLRLKHWAEELETAWQEAQTANQLKNEFLANTSHELRTPLNGIIGCLRLVRDGFCDDRDEELDFLQRADDAAIHLLGIINDVLDIARIEAGKLTVEIEPVDLRKLLDEVINLQAVPIQQKGLEFNTTDLHLVIPVEVDPAKLKQVLLNVVGNAVKFTDTGSITITTRIEEAKEIPSHSDDGTAPQKPVTSQVVIITVKDTGIGIDPTQQHKLFRPFVMVDGSTTRKCGGTGLGLAISRNLMEMMAGTITLFSDGEEKGTVVEITLPLIEASRLVSGELPTSNGAAPAPTTPDTSHADLNGSVPHASKVITGEL
ncbi:MAG TPA: ATP-binding protein, partial [Coleofasciculaceae cyanobacterium]